MRRLVILVVAVPMLFAAALTTATSARAETCATRWMVVEVQIANIANGRSVTSRYRISAVVCWNGTRSWSSASQPSVTFVSGAAASGFTKGNYLMSDNRTTDFWVNFRYRVQCTTFPFAVVDLYWYPRIKVGPTGGTSYERGSTSGPCYYMWPRVISTS